MTIDLWMEGFAATGQSGTAQKMGVYEAETLRDAVIAWSKEKSDRPRYLNPEKTAYWGCRFFDNEADARRNFG